MSLELEIAWERTSTLGEGPIWYQDSLYWVDIREGKVLRYTPSTGEKEIWEIGIQVGTVVPRSSGGLILATENGFMAFDPRTGSQEVLDSPSKDSMNGRFNDGKCDPLGNLLAGTIGSDKNGGFFRLNKKGKCEQLFDGVGCSNGLTWWENAFYYIDSGNKRVDKFDYHQETGDISNRRMAFSTESLPGVPDGMAIDTQGNLWIAFFNGNRVVCFDRDTGEILEEIPLPVPRVTACAFGGDDLGDLYITTASVGMSEEELGRHPQSGNLFVCRPGAVGIPANAFEG